MMQRAIAFMALVVLSFAAPAKSAEPEVYPAKGQTSQQQERDQFECHEWATKDTGVDPVALAEEKLAGSPASDKGGAAGGAAVGAMRGAAEGNAAGGAARGFGVGRMVSVLRAKRQLRERQSAAAQNEATVGEQLDRYGRAYAACLTGRGYSVK
jgi:hypothetical protein